MIKSIVRPLSIFAIATAGFAAAACSVAPDDDSGAIDDPLRLRPEGTETMSTLILRLPTGTCLPGESCARPLGRPPTFRLGNTAMTLGQPLRVVPGQHTLTVNNTSTTITLAAGATRTLVLPVAKRVCKEETAGALPATQFGRLPTLRNARCPSAISADGITIQEIPEPSAIAVYQGANCDVTTISSSLARSASCSSFTQGQFTARSVQAGGVCYRVPDREFRAFCESWVSGGAAAIGLQSFGFDTAVVPGTYTFSTETRNGQGTETRTLAEGDIKDLEFDLQLIGTVPARFDVNLNFRDPRELPDAAVSRITSNCERNYAVPAAASGVVNLKAFVFPECTYTMNVGGRNVPILQTTVNNIAIHRLDVDDVIVTREDGSTFITTGNYEIFFGGTRVAGPFNTNTGVDMLPGDYEVVVRYPTAEGQKTNRYNIKL
jgi:hypothetical protein